MTASEIDRYPIGRFARARTAPDPRTHEERLKAIEEAPAIIRALVDPLSEGQLESRYREGGWSIRQVVHHVPDSHMNAYIRMKLAATEEAPRITAYKEADWAELADVRAISVGVSLDLLTALHTRWVAFLRSLTDAQLHRPYVHPELGPTPMHEAVALYAWHGRHHAAHIRCALKSLV